MSITTYKRPASYASLIQLVNKNDAANGFNLTPANEDSAGNRIVVNFPTMPETLELARSATYDNYGQTPVTPDGMHIYQWTEPLKIPLKFCLSSQDQYYCQDDGPYALLRTAANLHALTMPTLTREGEKTQNLAAAEAPKTIPADMSAEQALLNKTGATAAGLGAYKNFYFPPACLLSITLASRPNQPALGIYCVGFIERVITTLRGPWLQGSFEQNTELRNLPSSIDCEFVFVNQPGYTNNFVNTGPGVGARFVSTTAKDIYNNFYNDVARASQPSATYADLDGNVN